MKKLIYALLPTLLLLSFIFMKMKKDPAKDFLNSLSPELLQKAQLEFDHSEKTNWHFVPSSMYQREGVSLKELNNNQREALQSLFKTYLSKSGVEKIEQIMGLEAVLRSMSGDSVMRDPGAYYVSFYGDPSGDSPWAWSFEGHHISLNFTIVGDEVVATPRFFGSNPATIPSGPREGERTLKMEEDLGFELINSMNSDQLEIAIFQEEPMREITTRNIPKADPLDPVGITYSSLNPQQKKTLIKIIDEYLSALPKALSNKKRRQVEDEGMEHLRFGWVGAREKGSAHYYRIQGLSFLLEFDNSQSGANHIHTVWRDFDGDFGRDLILEHYANSDHH
ncbi:DUF3500 domain-containing protein [Algoriphagus namhaensis]|uniref:DUF3500 domain-containing protein n=1 Tax=Algoriphagus namhaensis TaxID=915353 RepID=A0ABV8ARR6_9BACT